MIKKLTGLVAFGAGYLLGTKAGTQRYEQIKGILDDLRGRPRVQQATETLHHTASGFADKAKEAVNEQVDKVTSKTIDLTEKASATEGTGATGATGAPAPSTAPSTAPGAAPSTAPSSAPSTAPSGPGGTSSPS
jgi:hypothetical protein